MTSHPRTRSTDLDPNLDAVLGASARDARVVAGVGRDRRAVWLREAALRLDAAAEELIALAAEETRLGEGRLVGELKRTTFQARLFAEGVTQGDLSRARVDHADPGWGMGPRPDIRRGFVPIGPVLVFAASNFPFAFSVFGGDTVSALAAGCPVVVKAHPGHVHLSRRTAEIVADALRAEGAPEGTFGLIEGVAAGTAAVTDPRIQAVAFTGSTSGGRALFDLAMSRPDPVPFYGEFGSTNPTVVTPAGWKHRADDIIAGFANSVSLGAGQYCTKPGIVFVPDAAAFLTLMPSLPVQPMLNDGVVEQYRDSTADMAARVGVALEREDNPGGAPRLFRVHVEDVRADPGLLSLEMFGPAALIVEYSDLADVEALLAGMPGQLTATVQGGEQIEPDEAELVGSLAFRVGRVLYNDWPTGVTVTSAQQHGGPYPATSAPLTTSVGTAAAERFLRPVAFQNVPAAALPADLQDT
jgi:NADP-dependent aldehyde dehydrogenase